VVDVEEVSRKTLKILDGDRSSNTQVNGADNAVARRTTGWGLERESDLGSVGWQCRRQRPPRGQLVREEHSRVSFIS